MFGTNVRVQAKNKRKLTRDAHITTETKRESMNGKGNAIVFLVVVSLPVGPAIF